MAATLARYSGAVGVAVHPWYPPVSVIGAGIYNEQTIFESYLAHRSLHAQGKNLDVRRTFYVSSWIVNSRNAASDGADIANYAAYVSTEMATPGWWWYKDRPVLAVFEDGISTTWLSSWNAFKALLPPNVFILALGNWTSTQLNNVGAHAWATYGPAGATLSPFGRHAWGDQQTADQSHWGSTNGREVVASMTLGGDQRARAGDPRGTTHAFADEPTLAQWMAFQQQVGPSFLRVIYAGSEFTEAGAANLWGNAQRPTTYVDGLRFVKYPTGSLLRPTAYVDKIDTATLNFTRSGSPVWSRDESVTHTGAFDSDLMSLTAATDTLTSVSFPAVSRIRVMGARGGTAGSCTFVVDGGSAVVVDTNSGSGHQQELFDTDDFVPLSEGSHTIAISGHASNAGLSRRCLTDNVEITQNVRSLPYLGGVPANDLAQVATAPTRRRRRRGSLLALVA